MTESSVVAVIVEGVKAAAAVGSALVIFSFKSRTVRQAAIPPDDLRARSDANSRELATLRTDATATANALGKWNVRFAKFSDRLEALEKWRSDVKSKLSEDAGGWQRAIWEIEQMKLGAAAREQRIANLEQRLNRRWDDQ